jgi:trans-aconitate methyltransferase
MTSYYDSRENVEEYIKMADGFDGRALIARLKKYLPAGGSVLELGMGPGKDLDLLAESFRATGSDRSMVFLERYRRAYPQADLLRLDAVSLDTDRTFDVIYSNKVLHHLTQAELTESLRRQAERLNHNGLLLHTFWYGDKEESFSGLRFVYYTEESLKQMIGPEFRLVESERYTEMEDNDSICLILKKR